MSYFSPEKETAHPKALELLKEDFYWDICNDNSPFGNDDGADALSNYKNWHDENPNASAIEFLEDFFVGWDVNFDAWKLFDNKDHPDNFDPVYAYSIFTGDRVIISIAFGQILIKGEVDKDLLELALRAIDNEASPAVSQRWRDPAERIERLALMRSVLTQ